jgi:hypothetical protein
VRTATPTPTTVAPAATTGDRTLTSEGRAILPLTGRPPLSRYAGTTVQARVRVQLVAPNEGFWVGTSVRDRAWVQLIGTRESDFRVEPGDKVAFREDGRKLSRLRSTSQRDFWRRRRIA